MQQYALSMEGKRIYCIEASSGVDYICPECKNIVRVKKGKLRKAHFFHKNELVSCHLRYKHEFHSQVQSWIVEQLNSNYCTVECFFPTITRIADVAYHQKKCVFEIQVSPISAQEALERTYDYYSIGWHVIWILHAATFGGVISSEFEKNIMHIPHYFTDIGYANGKVYDEASYVLGKNRRFFSFPPLRKTLFPLSVQTVSPPRQERTTHPHISSLQSLIDFRKKSWSCNIAGDFLSSSNLSENKKPHIPLLSLYKERLFLWYLSLFT